MWCTHRAQISGFHGRKAIEIRIRRIRNIRSADSTRWRVGDEEHAMSANCLDLDLGFTPATNMIAIRRLRLKVGERGDAPAAWLTLPDLKLRTLPQTYTRSGKSDYRYEAPSEGYRGTLQVSRIGAVIKYPGLFSIVE